MTLDLNPEELNACVSCGLCLPHCPTYRVTGEEGLSPRGRIDAMRAVHDGGAAVDDSFVHFMETCVQCRGCEPACPSGVPYGHLIERTRAHLAETGRSTPRWQRWAFACLPKHRWLLVGSTLLAIAQRLRLVPQRLIGDRIPVRRGAPVRSVATDLASTDAWLFTGCVMDAWMRQVHRASAAVLDALGVAYAVPAAGAGCCGALHQHAGLTSASRKLIERSMAAMPGEAPILVNSAGCGAQLKEAGDLLGTAEARAFAGRVHDLQEWVAERADELPLRRGDLSVVVQDPCHLRHVQRAHEAVRELLERVADVHDTDDDGLCCGAGGAYATLQPELATQIRDRKVSAIADVLIATDADLVVSANPGCAMHLSGPLRPFEAEVRHPIELVAEALE